jgi:cardiolipin synthase A/B
MIDFLNTYWPYLLACLDICLAIAVTLHAVLYKPETGTVIAWVGLAWLSPFLGPIAYFFLGINRIQRKAVTLKLGEKIPPESIPPTVEEDYRLRDELLELCPGLLGLAELGKNVTGKTILRGNSITLLCNGDDAYPEMLSEINKAEKSVLLLSYIFDSDPVGDQFLEALKAAQKRGIEVRILVDSVGSDYSKPNMVERLRREDLNVSKFLPTRKLGLFRYANMRNHRKILIVDGRVGFTGGTNIRVGHALKMNPKTPVQCAHFRLDGPVVAHLREVFAIDWAFASGEILEGDFWYPRIARSEGFVGARGVSSGPDEELDHMSVVILGAISSARSNIRVVSPYFIPDTAIVKALNVAALRGIGVDIVLPSNNNMPIVEWASVMQLQELIEKGCRVHYSAPPFDHTKLMVIDSAWSLIGSTNWDPRSLRLNFEFNVECYSKDLAIQLEDYIDEKIAGGRLLTLKQIEGRKFPVRLRDGLARLASPFL